MITAARQGLFAALITGSGLVCAAGSLSQLFLQEVPQFTHDLTLQETTRTIGVAAGDRSIATTNYFSPNAMKRTAPDGNDTIIRIDEGKIITINHVK